MQKGKTKPQLKENNINKNIEDNNQPRKKEEPKITFCDNYFQEDTLSIEKKWKYQ